MPSIRVTTSDLSRVSFLAGEAVDETRGTSTAVVGMALSLSHLPQLVRSHDSRGSGVYLHGGGRAELHACAVHANARYGVKVLAPASCDLGRATPKRAGVWYSAQDESSISGNGVDFVAEEQLELRVEGVDVADVYA